MLQEKDTRSNHTLTEENEDVSDFDTNEMKTVGAFLTVDQLKSRLTEMNVSLDMVRHPKNFYVDMYTQALTDPSKRELIKQKLEEDREVRSKKKVKNSEKLINNKRHRPEEAEVDGKEEAQTYSKFNGRAPEFKDIKEPRDLKETKEMKDNTKETNNNNPLLSTPSVSSDKKIISSNVKVFSIKLSAPKAEESKAGMEVLAPARDENYAKPAENAPVLIRNNSITNSSTNNPMVKTSSSSNIQNLNILSRQNSRMNMPEVNNNVNKSQNNSDQFQVVVSPESGNINHPSQLYKNSRSNNIPNLKFNLMSSSSTNKLPSATQSNKSQPVVTSNNLFRYPYSGNQVFKNEFMRANSMRSSTNSINRVQLLNSINRTTLSSNNLKNVEDFPHFQHEPIEWRKYAKLFFFGLSAGAMAVAIWHILDNNIRELNFAEFPFMNKNTIVILSIGALLIVFAAYLIHWNKIYRQRENKLIADNCVQEIRNFLQERPDFNLQEENFINEYCLTNGRKVDDLRLNVLPFIKEMIRNDEVLEETLMNINGNAQTIWRFKN